MDTTNSITASVILASLSHFLIIVAPYTALILYFDGYSGLEISYRADFGLRFILTITGYYTVTSGIFFIFIMATIGYFFRKQLLNIGKPYLFYYLLFGFGQGVLRASVDMISPFIMYPNYDFEQFWRIQMNMDSFIIYAFVISIGTTASGLFWFFRRPDRDLQTEG